MSACLLAPPPISARLYTRTSFPKKFGLARGRKAHRESFGNQLSMGSRVVSPKAVSSAISEPEPPNVFDGTTRLYFSPMCPYAQRVSIAVNYKNLDSIERIEIDLVNKPAWYKEKVYPVGKVPALEHKGEVKGESLDLLYYLDEEFEGPSLLPQDADKISFAKEVIGCSDDIVKAGYSALSDDQLTAVQIEASFGPQLDKLEKALAKYPEGPFFLGNFGLVDTVYIPFFERFEIAYTDIHKSKYDLFANRPRLAQWFEGVNGLKAYNDTKLERSRVRETYERMLSSGYFRRIFPPSVPAK